MQVHHYDAEDNARCVVCGLGVYQMFTDLEDIEMGIYCLKKKAQIFAFMGWEHDYPEERILSQVEMLAMASQALSQSTTNVPIPG